VMNTLRPAFEPVHAKTVKNTENTDGQKTKYREKIRKIIIVGLSLVLRKNCILKIQVQRGLYFAVFFQIQRANICIGICTASNMIYTSILLSTVYYHVICCLLISKSATYG
jgi:hypothetical protein